MNFSETLGGVNFFRFLFCDAKTQIDLTACVPTVADWRLSSIPKYLAEEEVQRLLDACDRSTLTGRRDYAVLLLLARLGLRAGEVEDVVALGLAEVEHLRSIAGTRADVAALDGHRSEPLEEEARQMLEESERTPPPIVEDRRRSRLAPDG